MSRRRNIANRPGGLPGWLTTWSMLLTCGLAIAIPSPSRAQGWPDTGADAVASFTPGTGTGAGYGAAYFPGNVLGLPDSNSRTDVATVDSRQVLGLGLGGEIVLRFDRAPIVDIDGPDFTIFENAFDYQTGARTRRYAEPGEVAVSRDGVNFVAFPYDSLSLRGCAGVTPTHGRSNPGDPLVSGGDGFDLHDLGLDSVRYVRIRDITTVIKSNPTSPFWDVTLNGFDLDAVVRATVARPGALGVTAEGGWKGSASIAPNPFAAGGTLRVALPERAHLHARVVDLLGRDRMTLAEGIAEAGESRIMFDATLLPEGAYLIVLQADGRIIGTIRAQHIR